MALRDACRASPPLVAVAGAPRGRQSPAGQAGVDFNYGAPMDGSVQFGLSNIQFAAKYRFLHQDSFGLDVSFYPRLHQPRRAQRRRREHLVVCGDAVHLLSRPVDWRVAIAIIAAAARPAIRSGS